MREDICSIPVNEVFEPREGCPFCRMRDMLEDRMAVGIATALITSPRLIMADEPTTALDSITQRQIVDLLVSLVDEAGASMLFITHDFSVLTRATTRCVVLDEGSVVETGETATMLAAPQDERTARLVRAARTLTLRVSREGADRETDRGAAPSDDATADEHEGEA